MELYALLKLLTCVLSVTLASAIVGRDPGLRVNRAIAMIPSCTAYWSLCEFLAAIQDDAGVATTFIRMTSLGWMLLGSVSLHAFSEMGGGRPRFRRWVPLSYAVSLSCVVIYNTTSLGLVQAFRVDWGWSYRFGALFPLLYALTISPLAFILFRWSQVLPRGGSKSERMVWISIYAAVASAVTLASLSDVVLPFLGVDSMTLGTSIIAVVSSGVALQLRRYGYSLLDPEAFARDILEALEDGVLMIRDNGRIEKANAAFESLVEATPGSLRDQDCSRFFPEIAGELLHMRGENTTQLETLSGEMLPVAVTPARRHEAVGRRQGEAFIVRDIRELDALRDRLVTSSRLAAVGELSASLVEEMMEPVDEIRSHLEGIRMRSEAIELDRVDEKLADLLRERTELVEECLEGIDRITGILRGVRGYSSESSAPREICDLADLARNALRIASPRADSRTRIESELVSRVPVHCAADEIVQVVVNLLVNAFHASSEGGRVRITCEKIEDRSVLSIEDDGCGIEPDQMHRIFDPFFTTKPVGKGTGLGLSISHHIVRQHGGVIQVESTSGKGTVFQVVLACVPEQGIDTS